jgi:hypothetical protein
VSHPACLMIITYTPMRSANAANHVCADKYGAKYKKVMACLTKDREACWDRHRAERTQRSPLGAQA